MTGRSISVAPSNAGDRRGHVRPEERPQRVAPLRRFAEELDETLLLVAVVATDVAARCGSDSAARPRAPARRVFSVMRSRNMIVGTAAYGSGARVEHLEGEVAHRAFARTPSKNASSASCASRAAVETAPQRSQLADELVAGVDRHEIALALASSPGRRARGTPRRRAPASAQLGVRGGELVPRVERQQRLGRAGRARVERGTPARGWSSRRRTRRSPGSGAQSHCAGDRWRSGNAT